MTVIPIANSLIDETYNAVKLATFAQLAGYSEDQFNGLANPATQQEACKPIWTHAERALVARYLKEAQDEIETVLNYPLCPKWFINEQHPYKYPLRADWGKVIDVGYRHVETIHAGLALAFVSDPVAFTHATTETDEGNIRIYHPGTEIEIIPSHLEITGGNVLVEIPWARLVKESAVNNPADGWTYADVPPSVTSPYESTVDIATVHNNTDIQAGLVWPHQSTSCDDCCDLCVTCGEYTETACVYVRNYETGAMDIIPGTFSAGAWTSALCSSCYCADPTIVRINYRAGLTELPKDLEEAVILLAMAKMPQPVCGCGVISDWWGQANAAVETYGQAFGMRKAGAFRALDTVNKRALKRSFVIG